MIITVVCFIWSTCDQIKSNSRESLKPIIDFDIPRVDHFNEEEQLMRDHNFYDIHNHKKIINLFKHKIKLIEKMCNENLHTTHIAYNSSSNML